MSSAQTPLKNYLICYGQLLGHRPATWPDELAKQIIAGKLTDGQACRQLIDKLNPQALNEKNAESLTLLSRLNRLHSTFFVANDFYTDDYTYTMADLYDAESPAYVMTQTLLADKKLSSILEGKEQFMARRETPTPPTHFWTLRMDRDRFRFNRLNWGHPSNPVKMPLIERGVLTNLEVDRRHLEPVRVPASRHPNALTFSEIKRHQGGGIVGQPEYIILNNKDSYFDGGMYSYRRYGDRIIKDFLCRDLPVLKESDVTAFVEPHSDLPFRKATKCMSCHSTMDPIGQLIGHVNIKAPDEDDVTAFQYIYVKPIDVQKPSVFRYRTLDDELIQKDVANLDELGKAITSLNDFYWCAAKRYYQFVSGHDVEYTPNKTTRSEEQAGVYEIAMQLKEHQSLRKLLASSYELRFKLESHKKGQP